MISMDINISFLKKNYGIDTSRINEAGLTTIEEFMEAEAAQGNKSAVNFENDVYKSPKSILELYQLTSPKNRFLILKNLGTEDLQDLMQYLDTQVLYNALKFIPQDKLMGIVYQLPKEKLATIVFNSFSVENFLKVTNEKEIDKFFESPKIERNQITKYVQYLEQDKLQGLMELLTGKPCSHCDSKEVQAELNKLEDRQFARMLKAFAPDTKSQLIKLMTDDKPEYLLEFSGNALMKPLTMLNKQDFLTTLDVLEPEDYLMMLQEMPQEMLPMVVSQIDANVFAELLSSNFQEILKQIAL